MNVGLKCLNNDYQSFFNARWWVGSEKSNQNQGFSVEGYFVTSLYDDVVQAGFIVQTLSSA